MIRNCSLEEISDGKLYEADDLVKANCHDCIGCEKCCHGMGNSIVLDPYDIYQLTVQLGKSMEELLQSALELNVCDGLILPNIRMQEKTDACIFLTTEGRCGIHQYRPGMCRLFPLGRYYEGDSFWYFLQTGECPKENRSKIKVKQWLGIRPIKTYEAYLRDWHSYLKKLRERIAENDEKEQKQICMKLLQDFYLKPYENSDFYPQFYARLPKEGK